MGLYDIAREEKRRKASGEPPLPVPKRPPSFAERTGQASRFRVATWITALGGLLSLSGACRISHTAGSGWMWALLAGTLITAVGFVGQCLSVRCPRCRVAVVWHTYNHRSALVADQMAAWQVACPKCGFEPEIPDARKA
jgi:endogenous inhibitor of DNA gyrase (YacG/DUF329 family)